MEQKDLVLKDLLNVSENNLYVSVAWIFFKNRKSAAFGPVPQLVHVGPQQNGRPPTLKKSKKLFNSCSIEEKNWIQVEENKLKNLEKSWETPAKIRLSSTLREKWSQHHPCFPSKKCTDGQTQTFVTIKKCHI